MVCPVCKKAGLKSKVFEGDMGTTLLAGSSFYDEEGNHHRHNPNTYTTCYSCSNGHNWTVKSKQRCAFCDYNKNAMDITIIKGP